MVLLWGEIVLFTVFDGVPPRGLIISNSERVFLRDFFCQAEGGSHVLFLLIRCYNIERAGSPKFGLAPTAGSGASGPAEVAGALGGSVWLHAFPHRTSTSRRLSAKLPLPQSCSSPTCHPPAHVT